MSFKLTSTYTPTGDQPQAIAELVDGIEKKVNEQVLLGVTGSGKTFTMANVIARTQKPTLVISHNKTLAAQLYQEFKSFFPTNAVSYFVSYYDYYQPEAYIPQTDTYIEKETEINEEIDKLRLAATANILTRKDVVVIASVSCIYNIGSPENYGGFILELKPGVRITRQTIFERLIQLQYLRSEFGFKRGTFRVRGDIIDVFLAYEDYALRIELNGEKISALSSIDPLTGNTIEQKANFIVYPAKHYLTDVTQKMEVFDEIEKDLKNQVELLQSQQKIVEAQRLSQRVRYDLEMIREAGYVNGIENYSRYFDGRKPGDPPFSLLDYFQSAYKNDWLLIIDESHMTVPQVRGMYEGDRSRKTTLINFGFRLPAALDNRPLRFDEFTRRMPQTVYVSATPSEWEISRSIEAAHPLHTANSKLPTKTPGIVEQLIRPTGLVDPLIEIRPIKGQIEDLLTEITKRVEMHQRTLVTTLTKRMAEDLAEYLDNKKIKVQYLHADVLTLERTDILDKLRRGEYDVIVGINLLREGLDLPEVSLVAILDADKEGFLRSEVSLIQTMGRAARHLDGQVIMYADRTTGSMQRAIDEVTRRRNIQLKYNQENNITPISIHKPFRDRLVEAQEIDEIESLDKKTTSLATQLEVTIDSLTPQDKKRLIKRLTMQMKIAADELDFELAAEIRDKLKELKR